jgi:nitroreductase
MPTTFPSIAEIIRFRRTIHTFRPDVPPEERLLHALDLARWAPNHKLTEPWRFYLLGRQTALAIADLNGDLLDAQKGPGAGDAKRARWREMPGWLVITCRRSADPLRQKEDFAACCCAVQNLALVLWNEGIGLKWATGDIIRDGRFFDLLHIDPDREEVVGLFWYGYPAEVPDTLRRPLAEVLSRLD